MASSEKDMDTTLHYRITCLDSQYYYEYIEFNLLLFPPV